LAACQRKRLRFLRFSFTQRKRLRLNGNRSLDVETVAGVTLSLCARLFTLQYNYYKIFCSNTLTQSNTPLMPGAYPEIWIRRGVKGWSLVSSPPPSRPLPFSSPPLPYPPLPFPSLLSLPLEVGPLIQQGGLGERCKPPSGVWGGAPA